MTTPIQPGLQPAETLPAQAPTQSSKADAFQQWFAQAMVPASTPSPSSGTAPDPASSQAPAPKYETAVTGFNPNGSENIYNPGQFATLDTAQSVAKLVGGQAQEDQLGGPYTRTAPERVIVGAGQNILNAGLVADLFNKYGDAPGSFAWQVIDSDLGKTQV
jgi:hypothetical protein